MGKAPEEEQTKLATCWRSVVSIVCILHPHTTPADPLQRVSHLFLSLYGVKNFAPEFAFMAALKCSKIVLSVVIWRWDGDRMLFRRPKRARIMWNYTQQYYKVGNVFHFTLENFLNSLSVLFSTDFFGLYMQVFSTGCALFQERLVVRQSFQCLLDQFSNKH